MNTQDNSRFDRDARVVWINDQYRRFLPALGFERDEDFVGQPVSSVVHNTQMHRVLATGHHRAPLLGTVIRAFISDDAKARAIVTERKVDYVAICPTVPEPQNYAHDAPGGLAAELLAGRAPAWLEPVPASANDGWLVWRVRKPA